MTQIGLLWAAPLSFSPSSPPLPPAADSACFLRFFHHPPILSCSTEVATCDLSGGGIWGEGGGVISSPLPYFLTAHCYVGLRR